MRELNQIGTGHMKISSSFLVHDEIRAILKDVEHLTQYIYTIGFVLEILNRQVLFYSQIKFLSKYTFEILTIKGDLVVGLST